MIRPTHLLLLSTLCLAGRYTQAVAQDEKQAPNQKPAVTLKGGDPAPPLKVDKWLQGDEVKRFEPGQVYVIEFWATWCGPCIACMPHLAEIRAEYRDKGVTVIGFTSRDLQSSLDHNEAMVTEFVTKRGPQLKYTFAYADDGTATDTWLKAAGRSGLPCTFVVDKAGRIAYIGHPMYLPLVMPKVVTRSSDARAISDEMAKVEAELGEVSADLNCDPKAGLRSLKAFEAKYPPLADFLPSVRVKLSHLPKHGEAGEAKEYAEALVAHAVKRGDTLNLALVASIFRLGDGKESKELLAIAVKAAEAEVHLAGGTDAQALLNLAETHAAAGNAAKAKEYATKAVVAAAGEPAATKEYIEKAALQLQLAK